jgi:outer membrane protein assembly factor BamD
MLAPERDQSATRDAIKEIEIFLQRYPNSKLMTEARKLEREARDRLSMSSYRVGFYYFRVKWYQGAIDRFKEVLSTDPAFTNRDAVYYHLAESLYRMATVNPTQVNAALTAEALPYYERLLKEFEQSEYLEAAQKRVAELKTPQTQ